MRERNSDHRPSGKPPRREEGHKPFGAKHPGGKHPDGKHPGGKHPGGKPFAGKRFGKPKAAPWRGAARDRDGPVVLYGWHTVKAALENPQRHFHRLLATENAARRLAEDGVTLPLVPALVRPDDIAAGAGAAAVHQGLYAEADPLPSPELEDVATGGIVLVLDQITDPHNVGAIL